jgi:outer membrane protein TolC
MNLFPYRLLSLSALFCTASCYAQLPQPGAPAPRERRTTNSIEALPAAGQNPLSGSIQSGETTAGTIDLTLEGAIDRGLRYNLSIVQGDQNVRFRRAARLRALSELLPTLSIRPSISEQQVNLAAFGFPGFPGIPPVVGPFTVYDARAYARQTLSLEDWRNLRSGRESEHSAVLSNKDAREQVVLIVTAAYLQALSGEARIQSQRAQLDTAEAEYRQAVDRKNAGTVAGIDVLRAQVQAQSQQQRLIAYEGDFEKQKITLARMIGLPLAQQFRLTDRIEPQALPGEFTLQSVLQQAYKQRADYLAAESRVRAAELSKSAAAAARYPSIELDANYGTNGLSPTSLHGSFAVVGAVNIPIYQGGRVRADVEAADAVLRQRKAEVEDLRGQIDAEVRTALTDLNSASRQVEVATKNVDLAKQELQQSRDRFAAGVTNNLEVVQAQDAVALANENYISSLYYFNTAKASLLRSRGDAEQTIRTLLRSRK